MAGTRYSEARTLVRGLRRLRGESREQFKSKVLRLRRQFERFNVDVSELCQWLMSLRPDGKQGGDETKGFWEFFLEPERFLKDEEKEESDKYRRIVFDVAAGLDGESSKADVCLSRPVVDSACEVGRLPLTSTAARLFERLGALDASSRQVLLKAGAEWVVAHYLRGYQNWECQREEWEKEKTEWEREHSELMESVREEFNKIFKKLNITEKKPRICMWERLKARRNNCQYAGERIPVGRGSWKSHSRLCVKYKKFKDDYSRNQRDGKNFKNYFVENAKAYIDLRRTSRGTKALAMEKLVREHRNARWFPQAWQGYLKALEIKEETVLCAGSGLPHCVEFGADRDCDYNKHTNECKGYRKLLEGRPDLQKLEGLYREWRREYLSGPAKPSFRYPSKRNLPMPKIFGEGFFQVDFDNSVLALRMEGEAEGNFERFGFAAWPKDYEPRPDQANITSVHISFVGTRARVGFHFEVQHKQSRFGVSQDEIDELRSRKYPRRRQDQQFLDEARVRLVDSFDGDAEREMKVLAVDLGTGGGADAVFEGRSFKKAGRLQVVKIEKLYDSIPKQDKKSKEKKSEEEKKSEKEKGLSRWHVGRHLKDWAEGASKIAKKRGTEAEKIGEHDMRRLSLHVRWMIRDWVRLNASQIIEMAERNKVDLIVFESMRGFRVPGYDKLDEDKKRRLAFFAHGRIRRKVAEKAVERGMRVVTVPYLKSSQFCANCAKEQEDKNKWQRNKWRGCFRCEQCGYQVNSDENAARVLGRVFWGEIQLPVKLAE